MNASTHGRKTFILNGLVLRRRMRCDGEHKRVCATGECNTQRSAGCESTVFHERSACVQVRLPDLLLPLGSTWQFVRCDPGTNLVERVWRNRLFDLSILGGRSSLCRLEKMVQAREF